MNHTLVVSLAVAAFGLGLGCPVNGAELPAGIVWTTNTDEPLIGSPDAQRGGIFRDHMRAYPLTFRLVGPDASDAFANWSRAFSLDFRLVIRHPTTDEHIPWMATHWSIQEDHRTVYYKLETAARWSDGEPVTADDYVFAFAMLSSPHVVDPFWNTYMADQFESVEAIDDHTLKVVGKYASWRPLDHFFLFAMPRHATHLGENWVREAHLEYPVVVGPYVISEAVDGQRVTFRRIPDWWGNDRSYFRGLYNVDQIEIQVIGDEDRAFDHFKKGELTCFRVTTAKTWAEDTNFEAIQKGWAHKKRVFVDFPTGLYGFAMNLQLPIFQDQNFRKAVQHAFNFQEINDELMYGAYYRMTSAFTGSQYENKQLSPYEFDPKKVRDHLRLAGYAERGADGIFVRPDGQRASWTLTYGTSGLTRHLTVVQQAMKRLGLEMNLQILEGGTAFQRLLERAHEMAVVSQTTEFFPDPHQYFHSSFVSTKNNNNFWAYGDPESDRLIDVYRFSQDPSARLEAMHQLDARLHDAAFYVPFWTAPFVRMLYWDSLQWPEFFVPKRFELHQNWQVFWIDQSRAAALRQAMKDHRPLVPDTTVDIDPYGVKATLQRSFGEAIHP